MSVDLERTGIIEFAADAIHIVCLWPCTYHPYHLPCVATLAAQWPIAHQLEGSTTMEGDSLLFEDGRLSDTEREGDR